MESRELRQVPREPVGQVLTYEGRSIALVDLGRDASEALRVSWPTARPFHSGGVVESAWMVPMLGAGSTAASSLLAGNVFLATANPATLDDHRYRGRIGCHGADRDRCGRAVCRRPRRPDTGLGACDALYDRLVGDDVRAPRPGAENSRPARRCRGKRAAVHGRRRLRPVRGCGGRDRRHPVPIRGSATDSPTT